MGNKTASTIPKFRTAYDPGSERYGDLDFTGTESLTIQSAANECDINMIIERAQRGMMPPQTGRMAQFGDFTNTTDYQNMLNQVIAAQEEFELLPARVRDRFANDPAQLLKFVSDPSNRDEAVKLGLCETATTAPIQTAPVSSASPTPPAASAAASAAS